MAETTGISWARSTFNPWIGCQKVGPGCDHCYAEAWNTRLGGHNWGPDAERRRTSGPWANVQKWQRAAAKEKTFWPVFCASLADVFDNAVPPSWRMDLFALIKRCPDLTFLMVTKRIGNAPRMLPTDWGDGYRNVWLLSTVVTQAEMDRDGPKLLSVPAAVHGLSIEPQLEHIAIPAGIDWVITGGESRQGLAKPRPYDLQWARSLRKQCDHHGTAFFFKQAGHAPIGYDGKPIKLSGVGHKLHELPEELRAQDFPHDISRVDSADFKVLHRGPAPEQRGLFA